MHASTCLKNTYPRSSLAPTFLLLALPAAAITAVAVAVIVLHAAATGRGRSRPEDGYYCHHEHVRPSVTSLPCPSRAPQGEE